MEIKKDELYPGFLEKIHCLQRIVELGQELQEGSFRDMSYHQHQCQGFIINGYAGDRFRVSRETGRVNNKRNVPA